MNVLDLFAGAGGLSEGFRQAGFNIVAHVEMDKSACNTLRTREAYYYLRENNQLEEYYKYMKKEIKRDEFYSLIPEAYLKRVIENEISVDTIDGIAENILEKLSVLSNNKVDVIVGGPPCQAYSTAGRARDPNGMKDDPRNFLYKYYISFLRIFQPKVFIFENVNGILTAQNGNIFKNLTRDLEKSYYKIEHRILNAADFGVAQERKRVILIGWKSNLDYEYPSFDVTNSMFTIQELFSDLPRLGAGGSIDGEKKYKNTNSPHLFIRSKDWSILTQHIVRPNNDNDLEIYRKVVETWNREKRLLKYNELPKKNQTHKNTKSFLDRYKLLKFDEPSHTVVAHISKDGHYYIHPDIKQNRSISVREAARIQSFPDDYYFEDSRTAAFRQIGNAVPPLMAYKMAIKIKQMLS